MAPTWAGPGLLKVIVGCILEKSKNENFEQAHSAEKSERGDRTLWDFFKNPFCWKISKNEEGTFWRHYKISKKSLCRKTWDISVERGTLLF